MQAAVGEASRIVLNGCELGTDVEIVRYPDRYMDPRGAVMWDRVMKLLPTRGPLESGRQSQTMAAT